MTLAPEIRSFIKWENALNDRHGELPLPELRHVFRAELDEELRRRGVFVEVGAITQHEHTPRGADWPP